MVIDSHSIVNQTKKAIYEHDYSKLISLDHRYIVWALSVHHLCISCAILHS
jgi:hypothetical protein